MKTYTFLYVYTLFECMEKEKRKPGQRSRTGETKGEIIKYALEHGGMFEGTVLKDFLEEKCNVRRETTKKHLAGLNKKGIFEKTGEKGYTNTWQIVEDTKAIAIIYKEYPHLLRYLQQSDFILDCVAKTESMLFEDEDAFKELKKMLRLSPKMFELCLTVDNLGAKFASLSSKIDYHGAWNMVSRKCPELEITRLYLTDVSSGFFCAVGDPKEGVIDTEIVPIKSYLRWELFKTTLKTDMSFLDTEKITEEVNELLSAEMLDEKLAFLFVSDSEKDVVEKIKTWEIQNLEKK